MKKKSTCRELKFMSLLVMLLLLGSAFSLKAADVTINSVTTFAQALALYDEDLSTPDILDISGNLTIQNGGTITSSATANNSNAGSIYIKVGQFMVIEAGGAIYSESHFTQSQAGNITIEVDSSFTMGGESLPIPGAIISSGQFAATSMNGSAGFITIHAGKFITLEPGSTVTAYSAKFTGGTIEIIAYGLKFGNIDIDGSVLSESTGSGTGSNQGHGGFIWIESYHFNLLISDEGKVSSKGTDPGADLVHLEACDVTIYGLVQSTGSGHAVPYNPPNHLDNTYRPDKPAHSTAGVEVWGRVIIIDNTFPHRGQINADLCCGGGTTGESWIDVFARQNIDITGSTDPNDKFAVHANGYAGNSDNGGIVTIKSDSGLINLDGRATQNDGTLIGGTTTVEARQDVNLLFDLVMNAKGSTASNGTGGKIFLRSYGEAPSSGTIYNELTSVLNVTGDNPPNGKVYLTACDPPNYIGVIIPHPPINPIYATACGGTPTFASYVEFQDTCGRGGDTTNPKCPICVAPSIDIVVDQNVTINFNTNPPTYTGDPDLQTYYSYDNSGATPDKWFAKFDLGSNRLVITNNAIITVTKVGSGNNLYAPGLQFVSTCEMLMDEGTHIIVESTNRNAGDISIEMSGDISINGEIRNEVTGSLGLPGAIYIKSLCGDIYVGPPGRIFDLGVDPGGNLISLQTCDGDITVDNGLVKAFAHAHADNLDITRPRIIVNANAGTYGDGNVLINANTVEPIYDEITVGGGKYDLWGGLLSWVSTNARPGMVWVQAAGDITVNGHGADPTPPVRTSYGAIAAISTASNATGGLVDIRSIGGIINGYNRAFDVSGKNNSLWGGATINLFAKSNIELYKTSGTNATFNPVVTSAGTTKGGTNNISSYHGCIIIGDGAIVTATISGKNYFTYCTCYTNPAGTVTPAPILAVNCADDPVALYAFCVSPFVKSAPDIVNNPVPSNGMLLYPNPANGSFTLQVNNSINQSSTLTMLDMTGKEILHSVLQLQEGVNSYPVSVAGISEGVYIVRLQTGTQIRQAKLIINR